MAVGLCRVLLLVGCGTSSGCFRLDLSSKEGVDCIEPVMQDSVFGRLDQVPPLVGHDAEHVFIRRFCKKDKITHLKEFGTLTV